MKYEPITFYRKDVVGHDELYNDVYELVECGKSECLLIGWNHNDVELYGRNVIDTQIRIMTMAQSEIVNASSHVQISGLLYKVNDTTGNNDARWRILFIDKYGSEPNGNQS